MDAIAAGNHGPAAAGIFLLIFGHVTTDYLRCVAAKCTTSSRENGVVAASMPFIQRLAKSRSVIERPDA
jgi:hypothetical protein